MPISVDEIISDTENSLLLPFFNLKPCCFFHGLSLLLRDGRGLWGGLHVLSPGLKASEIWGFLSLCC